VPGGGPVADESVPVLVGGFRITADATVPAAGAEGVLAALGDWNGGWELYAVDQRLAFCFSRGGELLRVVGVSDLPAGRHRLSATLDGGTFRLWCDDEPSGSLHFDGDLPFALQHGGAGLRLGYDEGFPVCDDYTPPAPWTGTLYRVLIEPGAPAGPPDVRAALHAD
jgi:hypothetical protein